MIGPVPGHLCPRTARARSMSSAPSATAKPDVIAANGERKGALAFIIDEEGAIRQFVSLILQGSGVDTIEFVDGASLRDRPTGRAPAPPPSSTTSNRPASR